MDFGRKEFGRKEFGRKEFGRKEFGRKEFGRITDILYYRQPISVPAVWAG
jgi:hypothetical protein